jgi:trehalose-6-phosphate synthase
LKKKFVFIQQGQESRIHIARYKALNDEINAAVEHINWRFSEDEWSPIIMTRQFIDYQDVLALYRMAKVCLVGSLHDGMNLVAKEFCAARSDLNASLVLSKFTGSAWELADALIINLYKALTMKPDEVRGRMKRLRNIVKDHNIYRWAARMLSELENANF